jgi:hypothetical protein
MNSKGLAAWPDGITEECEELALYANKIKKVPASIGQLKKLVRAPERAPLSRAGWVVPHGNLSLPTSPRSECSTSSTTSSACPSRRRSAR